MATAIDTLNNSVINQNSQQTPWNAQDFAGRLGPGGFVAGNFAVSSGWNPGEQNDPTKKMFTVYGPQGQVASFTGEQNFNNWYNSQGKLTPIPSGGGGGGGGMSTAARLAEERKKIVEGRKNDLIAGINQRYEDQQKDFASSENLVRSTNEMGKSRITTNRDYAITQAKQQGESSAKQARQQYQDALVQTRRRARAMGGAGSSGFLELNNLLDRELQGTLGGINQGVQNVTGQATNVAQNALNDLELSLQKAIASIESDKRTSRREKDSAIKEAEFAAADQAVQIESWLADYQQKASASSAASNARAEQQNVLSAYANDLARIQSGELGMTVQQLNQAYAPHFAQAGVGLNDAQNYQGFLGLGNQGLSEDEKYLLDLGYKYDSLSQNNQNDTFNNISKYYNNVTGTLNLGAYGNAQKYTQIQNKYFSGQELTPDELQFLQQYQ